MADNAPRSPLSPQEAAALGLAVLGHVGLVAALVLLKPTDPPPPPPGRMAVSLTSETGLISTAPDPQPDAARDAGPVLGDMVPPPEPEPIPLAKAQTLPVPAPALRPLAKPLTLQAKPTTRPPVRPSPITRPPRPGSKPGSSSFDNAFRDGIPGAKPNGTNSTPPATITGAVRVSLASEVARQLKRKWVGPNGLEVEKLSTTVEWNLNPDGSLAGEPRVIAHDGVTDANKSQSKRHQEQALKAVRLAAPFNLPPQYYSAWKRLRFTFDWKISQ
jgi:hypothetical protein